MARARRVIGIVLIVLAVLLGGLVAGVYAVLNTRALDRIVHKYADEYVDGDVSWSKIRISPFRNFPDVRVSIDSLVLTYPHERHSKWDVARGNVLLEAGRGPVKDTLASFASFSVSVAPWKFREGHLDAGRVSLSGLRAFAHAYPDSTANWQMIRLPESKDTSALSLPWIELAKVHVEKPVIVFTSQGKGIYAQLGMESLAVKGDIKVEDSLTLRDIKAELLGSRLKGETGAIRADADFDLKADVHGLLGQSRYPESKASVAISRSRVDYLPMDVSASLVLDADAAMDSKGRVDAVVDRLLASIPGLSVDADGEIADLLGKDPHFKIGAVADAELGKLMRFLPDEGGISAAGDLDIRLKADANLSQLNQYKFRNASIKGSIVSDRVDVSMRGDSLDVNAYRPDIEFVSNVDCIDVDMDLDSVVLAKGSSLLAKARDMRNCGRLTSVERHGQNVPRFDLHSISDRLFLKTGVSRMGVESADVNLALERRVRPPRRPRGEMPDSLRRRLAASRYVAGEFADKDIKVKLDSSITAYLKQWRPSGRLDLGRGFFASPAMPLRTRLYAFKGTFDANSLHLDTLALSSGTSDISASGKVGGIMRFTRGRGVLDLDLALDSRRLNINEIIAALDAGKGAEDTAVSEDDESFVTDRYADAEVETSDVGLVVVPGNIDATLAVRADTVDYTDIVISPLSAAVRMKDRTLQLLNTSLSTNLGDIEADAYYSTKSRRDISAGANLKVSRASAYDLIHLIPSVEEMMPAIKSFEGDLACELSATTQIDTMMNVVMPSLDGVIRVSGKDLMVRDAGNLRKITRLLLFKDKNIGRIDDLTVDAVVHDSKLEVFPFELGVDRYRMALHGMQGFDGTMNYHLSLLKSPFLILFGINMYGTLDNWRFSLGRARYRDGKVPAFTQQMDSVQVNIGRSIRDIFKVGVDNARKYNSKNVSDISGNSGKLRPSAPMLDGTDMMSGEDFDKLDSLLFENMLHEMDAALESEVDEIIEESFLQTQDLIKEYESLTYQKGMDRKIARLKEESERRKAAKKKK